MARVLIVGCGGRGRALAGELAERGHAVRGTTRDSDALGAIEGAGVEAVQADPDRLGTLLPHLAGVSVVVWLMATAEGSEEQVAALHGPRLESILGKLVDSGVRGFVYESVGTVDGDVLAAGAALTRHAGEIHRMPVALITEDPAAGDAWRTVAAAAVDRVLGA